MEPEDAAVIRNEEDESTPQSVTGRWAGALTNYMAQADYASLEMRTFAYLAGESLMGDFITVDSVPAEGPSMGAEDRPLSTLEKFRRLYDENRFKQMTGDSELNPGSTDEIVKQHALLYPQKDTPYTPVYPDEQSQGDQVFNIIELSDHGATARKMRLIRTMIERNPSLLDNHYLIRKLEAQYTQAAVRGAAAPVIRLYPEYYKGLVEEMVAEGKLPIATKAEKIAAEHKICHRTLEKLKREPAYNKIEAAIKAAATSSMQFWEKLQGTYVLAKCRPVKAFREKHKGLAAVDGHEFIFYVTTSPKSVSKDGSEYIVMIPIVPAEYAAVQIREGLVNRKDRAVGLRHSDAQFIRSVSNAEAERIIAINAAKRKIDLDD